MVLALGALAVGIALVGCTSGDATQPRTEEPRFATPSPGSGPQGRTPTPTASRGGGAPSPTPTIDATGDFFMRVTEPASTEVITDGTNIEVRGRTRVDAVVSINDTIVQPDSTGTFWWVVGLDPGVNTIEVIASVLSGEQEWVVLTVVSVPSSER